MRFETLNCLLIVAKGSSLDIEFGASRWSASAWINIDKNSKELYDKRLTNIVLIILIKTNKNPNPFKGTLPVERERKRDNVERDS